MTYTHRSDFPQDLPEKRAEYCYLCHAPSIEKRFSGSGDTQRVHFFCRTCKKESGRALMWDPVMTQFFNDDGFLVHEGAGMLILNEKKEILMMERVKYPFLWTIPGGHMEPGEDPKKAAQREIQEEVGLTVHDVSLIFEGEIVGDECMGGADIHKWYLYGATVRGESDIKLNDEAGMYQWVTQNALPQEITFPVAYLLQQEGVKEYLA